MGSSPLAVNVTLVGLEPNTSDMVAAITASLHDAFLLQAAMFVPLYPSDLYHAILSTPGVEHFTMTAPAAAITPTGSQLPVMGTLTVS